MTGELFCQKIKSFLRQKGVRKTLPVKLEELYMSVTSFESFMDGRGNKVSMRDIMVYLEFVHIGIVMKTDEMTSIIFTYEDMVVCLSCIREIRGLSRKKVWGVFDKEKKVTVYVIDFIRVCKKLSITMEFVSY